MPHKYTVTRYVNAGENYVHSIIILRYGNIVYHPEITATYNNDTLFSVLLYGTEGAIPYSKLELQRDLVFIKSLSLPAIRRIEVKENILVDNGEIYRIIESKNDSIFCINKDTLSLYQIH